MGTAGMNQIANPVSSPRQLSDQFPEGRVGLRAPPGRRACWDASSGTALGELAAAGSRGSEASGLRTSWYTFPACGPRGGIFEAPISSVGDVSVVDRLGLARAGEGSGAVRATHEDRLAGVGIPEPFVHDQDPTEVREVRNGPQHRARQV